MSIYSSGDFVVLTLDSPGKVGIEPGMLKYKDKVFRISKVVPALAEARASMYPEYYELEGVVSEKGKPYGVTGDWIRRVEAD